MATALVFAIAAFVVSAATTAFQVIQAKKQKKEAMIAADARKGFELVVEGSPDFAPIVYGRALIGGNRVWSGIANDFKYVASNAEKTFLTGSGGQAGYVNSYLSRVSKTANYDGDEYATAMQVRNVTAEPAGYMSASLSGGRNDFL